MARIVLGLGTSHSPQLSLPPEHWLQRGEEDQHNQSLYRVPDGTHVTYEALLAEVDSRVAKELQPEVFQKRHAANQQGIAQVAAALERSAPDVLVVLGDRDFAGPADPLEHPFRRVARPCAEPGTPGAWHRGRRLVSLDGTTIGPPDAPALEKHRRRDEGGTTVRVIDCRLAGVPGAEPLYRLLTTLLDPAAAPAAEPAALYHERW